MSYRGFQLTDADGVELPDPTGKQPNALSCEGCPTHACFCLHVLSTRLKRGRKGQRLVGLPVEGAPVTLMYNTSDYAAPDDAHLGVDDL